MKVAVTVLTCLCTLAAVAAVTRVVSTTVDDEPSLLSTEKTSVLERSFHPRMLRSRPHRISNGYHASNARAVGKNGRLGRLRRPSTGRWSFRPRISLPRQHKRFHVRGRTGSQHQGSKRHSLSLQQSNNGPIRYRGGRVITGSNEPPAVQVYLLYYGNWTAEQRSILESFVNSLSASEGTLASWWNISAPYYQLSGDGTASFVPSQVSWGEEAQMHRDARSWQRTGHCPVHAPSYWCNLRLLDTVTVLL